MNERIRRLLGEITALELVAYAQEIAARTEQYWCPIKHARKVLGTHSWYVQFLDYGDAEGYPAGLARLRGELMAKRVSAPGDRGRP